MLFPQPSPRRPPPFPSTPTPTPHPDPTLTLVPALSSQIFGRESEFFANLAVDAMQMVKEVNPETGKAIYPVKSVGIIKQHGRSFKDSALIPGYVFYGGRAGQGMPRTVKNVRAEGLEPPTPGPYPIAHSPEAD